MSNTEQEINDAPAADPARSEAPQSASAEDKGKGKFIRPNDDMGKSIEEDDDDDDDDEEEEEGDEDDDDAMEEEDDYQEINHQAILPQGRRTRGIKVDYTSPEALKKAGLDNGEPVDGDEEDEGNTA